MQSKKDTTNVRMNFLRVPSAQSLVVGTLQKPMLSATRVRQSNFEHGFLDPHIIEDAFMISYQHITLKGELWVDGKNVTPARHEGHSIAIYDLRREWKANLLTPFDCVNFYLPRRILDFVSGAEGVSPVEDLYTKAGASLDDAAMRGLVQALKPALDNPRGANTLFVDHIGLALASHVVRTYSDASPLHKDDEGPELSPFEIDMLKQLIVTKLDGGISLPEIAAATNLPITILTSGFKKAEGVTLYGWLQQKRVEIVKECLRNSNTSISEVAQFAGFSSVDHLSRVFAYFTGSSPSEWRNN